MDSLFQASERRAIARFHRFNFLAYSLEKSHLMTHFGIICPAAPSHLNLFTTLGYELKQRGHRVSLIGIEYAREKAITAGLEFQAIGQADFSEGTTRKSLDKLADLSGFLGLLYSMRFLGVQAVRTCLQDAPEVIRSTGIEALLVDQVSFEGGTIAEHLKIPFVSVCSAVTLNRSRGIPPFITPWHYDPSWRGEVRDRIGYQILDFLEKSQRDLVNEYRQRWKLPLLSNLNESYSSLAQISQQPAEFEFPRSDLPDWFHFTGPFLSIARREPVPFPYEKLTGKPLVYASMGTVQNGLSWIFETIAESCTDLDIQLIISLGGGAIPESLPKTSEKIIVVRYAPQLELLQKAALTITHGGMNTTLESLKNGVPMIVIPITNDQPGVSARVAWTGTGKVIPFGKVSAERLRNSIREVLTDDFYKKNALRLQQAIARSGGVHEAADIVEQAISTGKPVLSRTNRSEKFNK